MNLFKRNSGIKANLGIEVQSSGLAIAVCGDKQLNEGDEEARFQILNLHKLEDEASQGDRTLALADWVESQQLKGCKCSLTLRNGAYQLLLTEAPDVPEPEMRDAVRWKVKDLANIPVDKAAIELFLLPSDGAKSAKQMAYVVVTELDRIKSLIEMVNEAGLELSAIEIAEMSLRNLTLLKPEGQEGANGIAFVHLSEGKATVYLYRAGNLYLSRQFNLAYGGGLLDDIPEDSFLLEVQRSLDYYDRQMGQVPPVVLYVCGENISPDKITMNIARGLSVPARYLGLEEMFNLAESVEEDLLQECISAVGVALRDRVSS